MAPHSPVISLIASVAGHVRGMFRLHALGACVIAIGLASVARADIYKWTDKDSILHYSDVAPTSEAHATNVVVTTRSSNKPAQPAGPTQQELLARIQSLEQQLQAQRDAVPPPAVAVAPSYPAYYAPAVPAPAPYYPSPPVQAMTYYDGGYVNAFDNSFYSPFLSVGPPFYVVSLIRTRAPRFGSAHRAFGHGAFHGVSRGGHGGGRPGRRR